MKRKTLKFTTYLVPLVLSGEKYTTFRLFDDKDIQEGGVIGFYHKEGGEKFATAKVTKVYEKLLET